jgi:hypothetical protein
LKTNTSAIQTLAGRNVWTRESTPHIPLEIATFDAGDIVGLSRDAASGIAPIDSEGTNASLLVIMCSRIAGCRRDIQSDSS